MSKLEFEYKTLGCVTENHWFFSNILLLNVQKHDKFGSLLAEPMIISKPQSYLQSHQCHAI